MREWEGRPFPESKYSVRVRGNSGYNGLDIYI